MERMNPQSVDASSVILHSCSHPKALEIPDIISKDSLLNRRDIMTGKVMSRITIIAITPQELFIKLRLEVMVFKDSLTNPPTIGIKLPIANLAVRIDKESAPWVKTL